MTDRYTELVKQAYEAQQAREGERYQSLTSDLARIDADLEALAAKREDAVSVLESMDDALEAAKEALDAYFAGREEGDEGLFSETPDAIESALSPEDQQFYSGDQWGADAMARFASDSEFETAKANGALTD
jgi:predicted  nucleic acid-binding Zn-ribbon protein